MERHKLSAWDIERITAEEKIVLLALVERGAGRKPADLDQVARVCGLSAREVNDAVSTLAEHGWLERNDDDVTVDEVFFDDTDDE